MKRLQHGLISILLLAYPFLVGYSIYTQQYIWVSLLLIGLGLTRLLTKNRQLMWPLAAFAVLCGGLSLIFQQHAWLRLYPVMMSLGALVIFATTLIRPPSMIERFARLMDANLPESGVIWTRKVTWVWCGFFLINACIALITVYWLPLEYWVAYNGFISYLLMGLLLLGEYILRKRHQKKHAE